MKDRFELRLAKTDIIKFLEQIVDSKTVRIIAAVVLIVITLDRIFPPPVNYEYSRIIEASDGTGIFNKAASYMISEILSSNERPCFPNILSFATQLPMPALIIITVMLTILSTVNLILMKAYILLLK